MHEQALEMRDGGYVVASQVGKGMVEDARRTSSGTRVVRVGDAVITGSVGVSSTASGSALFIFACSTGET